MSHIQLTEMPQNDSARKEPIFLFYGFSIRLKPQNIERTSQIPEQKLWLHGHKSCPPHHTIVTWEGKGVLSVLSVSSRKRGTICHESNMAARWDVCKCFHFKSPWDMSERKISKALRKDRESTVSAVDIKSLTSSESTFSLRPLKVGEVLMIL